ncbi:hypothetical protein SAY87_017847 [Trapa incisa]|uniref:Uncharacterized protein n=1 Tax=Trapa incisa TaxID=236973 RepID=A0AAN7L337_9MYRT|nr:hypothetical protein SAY87_017847 [Trapa incisa]
MSRSVLALAAVAREKLSLELSSSDKQYALHGKIFMFVSILCFSLFQFFFFFVLLPFSQAFDKRLPLRPIGTRFSAYRGDAHRA